MGYSLGQRLVGTIFAVSLCLANTVAPSFFFFLDGHHLHTLPLPSSRGPEKPRGKLLHASGAPVFVADIQVMPLDHLALVERGTCIPVSHRTVTIGKTIPGRLPASEHCKDSRHTPVFPRKSLFACAVALA